MKMRPVVHGVVGGFAMLCIASFWGSTVVAELFLSNAAIVAVKTGILWAMWVFIPLMVMTGGSGFSLAKGFGGGLLGTKKKRMPFIAMNGLLVLLPCAYYLWGKAVAGEFDTVFMLVQGVELVFGMVNLVLMGLNFRDGLRLSHRVG